MKIRTRFMACLGLLGMVATVVATTQIATAVRTLSSMSLAILQSEAFGATMIASEKLLMERGAWNTTFSLAAASSPETLAALRASIVVTDDTIAAARRAGERAGIDVSALADAARIMQGMRSASFPVIAVPRTARPANAQAAMGEASIKAVAAVSRFVEVIEQVTSANVPGLSQPLMLARLSTDMRAINGARSTLTSIFVAGTQLSADQQREAVLLTGAVGELWRNQQDLVVGMGSPPDLMTAIETVRSTLMTVGEQRYQQIIDAATHGRQPPLSNAEWRTWTVPMLNNVLVLRNAALARIQRFNEEGLRSAWVQLGISVAVLLTFLSALGATWLMVNRGVVRPLARMTLTIRSMAEGLLDVTVHDTDRTDEIGAVAGALSVLRENALAARTAEHEAALAQRARLDSAQALSGHAAGFEARGKAALADVGGEVMAMRRSAEMLAVNAAEVARDAGAQAQAVAGIRNDIDGMAAATEELAVSAGDVAERMGQAAHAARDAARAAGEGRSQVAELKAGADQIGGITRLIRDIAQRTNLLALNATIEAARAGAAGQGFAVVAGEVKNLAAQTARATEDVERHVSSIRDATEAAAASIGKVDETVTGVAALADEIAGAVAEQRAAVAEIARAVQSAAQGSAVVGDASQRVSAATERSSGEAADVNERISAAAAAITRLDREVTGFLAAVQAA